MISSKKILFLGGAKHQSTILSLAQKKDYYVILCDGDFDCYGKKYADKFYNVSTSDKYKILEIAKKQKISAIISYASEIGALTQCFVANKLKLPTNKIKSIETLVYKNKFKNFLKKINFYVPKFKVFTKFNDLKLYLKNNKNNYIIKPIDSSGSRGVFKVNGINLLKLKKKFIASKKISIKKKVICEEFISTNLPQIAGDAVIFNQKIIFSHWGDQYYNIFTNPLLPVAESWPTIHTKKNILYIERELNKLLKILKISIGVFNFDMRLTNDGRRMIVEIAPRNGGDYIAEVVKKATGVDMIQQTLNLYLGIKILKKDLLKFKNENCASLRLGASKKGFLKKIYFSKKIKKLIYKKYLLKKRNDVVQKFVLGKESLGNIFLKFKNFNQMKNIMNDFNQYINIVVNKKI